MKEIKILLILADAKGDLTKQQEMILSECTYVQHSTDYSVSVFATEDVSNILDYLHDVTDGFEPNTYNIYVPMIEADVVIEIIR